MTVVPLTPQGTEPRVGTSVYQDEQSRHWARIAAGGALLAGGVLLLTGQRRAGLLAAVGGTTLAVLSQQDSVRAWWKALPHYIAEADRLVSRTQQTVSDLSSQGDRLLQMLKRS
jgi:hypothetical protein